MMARTALDRAKGRLAYARAELRRFEQSMNDPDDPQSHRTWRKLTEDVRRAERDVVSLRSVKMAG
jgi:hypothetical protein